MNLFSNHSDDTRPVAIVSSDNSHYRDFAPTCEKAWSDLGFSFLHAELGSEQYPEIPGLSLALQAQILRLYVSTTLHNRIVLLSDIDMLPMSSRYFHSKLPRNSKDVCVTSSHAYRRGRFPICYISAYSTTLADILLDNLHESWPQFAKRLSNLRFGWDTDELYCTGRIRGSNYCVIEHKRIWIKGFAFRRIDRVLPVTSLVPFPIDFHCPRPYSKYSSYINNKLRRLW